MNELVVLITLPTLLFGSTIWYALTTKVGDSE